MRHQDLETTKPYFSTVSEHKSIWRMDILHGNNRLISIAMGKRNGSLEAVFCLQKQIPRLPRCVIV